MPRDSKPPNPELGPFRVEINGESAWVTYLDAMWHVVPQAEATQAIAILDNGGRMYFKVRA
jgi:hypothetical protein